MTVAGAPIDFHAGQAPIADYVSMLSAGGTLEPYRAAVRSANGVLPGQFLVGGFIALKPEDEWRKHLELLLNLDDPAFVERYAHFEDWLKHPQAIPGAFYLWILEELFVGNRLVQGSVRVAGEAVALGRIACPVTMIAGTADHITPPEQVFALAGHLATPARRRTEITVEAGHLGLFMSRTALAEVWLPTFGRLAAG